jgi:hypothetical protein
LNDSTWRDGKGFETRDTVLACYGGVGFTEELRARPAATFG